MKNPWWEKDTNKFLEKKKNEINNEWKSVLNFQIFAQLRTQDIFYYFDVYYF